MEPRELADRGEELATLGELLNAAQAGRGSIVILEGAPGIGKTSLLQATAEMARQRGLALRSCRGTELERDLPLGAARQLLPEAPSFDVADQVPIDRGLAVLEGLRGLAIEAASGEDGDRPRGAALLVDDAHVVDNPSLRFLCHLALSVERAPVAIVIAVRTGAPAAPEQLLAELRSAPASRILRPRPLSAEAVGEIVRTSWGGDTGDEVVAACARVSGGNPFYLTELLRDLAEAGSPSIETIERAAPRNVLHAVLARLGRCGPDGAALARAVAVIGDGCSLSLAARLADLPLAAAEDAADTLARAEILDRSEPLRFSHSLIASTLHDDVGAFALARAHGDTARILRELGAPSDQVAMHLLHAPPAGDQEALATLRAAADSALGRGEPGTAAKLLERALAEPPADDARGEVLFALANAEATAGRREAIPHFEQALMSVTDPRSRGRLHLALAKTLHQAGDFGRAADLAEHGRAQLDASDPLSEQLLSTWIAAAMLHGPLLGRMEELASPLIERAESGWIPQDPGLRSQLSSWMVGRDRPADAAAALAEAAFAADPLVDGDPRGAALGFAAASLIYLDRLDAAERHLELAVAAADRRGAIVARSIARHFQAYVHHHRGRLAQAVACAEQSLEIYRYGWIESPWSVPILALAHVHKGDLDAAREAIALAEQAGTEYVEHALLLEARAALSLAAGAPEAALDDARAAGAIAEEAFATRSSRIFDWTRIAALAAARAGRGGEALEFAQGAIERAESGRTPRQLGTALTCLGLVRGGEEGLGLLQRAVETLERSPSRYYLLEAKLELGSALRRSGRRAEGRELLYQALELADAFGAEPAVARARGELASLGLRPRRAARAGVDSLTPTEQRVAALAATGRTTREIAGELYLSPKTIENHLTRIYRKLGVGSRAELMTKLPAGAAGPGVDE